MFFGADKGPEDIEWRAQKFQVEQQYGRSLARDKALSAEPFLAYALNGQPLTRHQGSPLRLIVPGWYGAPNVKWLAQIHAQEDQYLGKFQARWYRTLKGEMIDGEMKWVETAITHLQLKSFVARVSKQGNTHRVLGIVLNDGTPIKSVEVKIDEGPWQPATMDAATNAKYGWKLFHYTWNGATPGEHTLVSRVTDATGKVQPTAEELESKKTFLEDNSQHPRKVDRSPSSALSCPALGARARSGTGTQHDGTKDRTRNAARGTRNSVPCNVLLLSMPDSFEHTPSLTMRMPNGALASLAGNLDAHHQVSIADLVLVQDRVGPTVERLVRTLNPDARRPVDHDLPAPHRAGDHPLHPRPEARREGRRRRLRSEPRA